jgi:lysophospholipase L1-like esterase
MRSLGARGRLKLVIAAAQVAVAVLLAGCSPGSAGSPGPGQGWVAAWGASPVAGATIPGLTCPASTGLVNQTVRNVVFLSAGGDQVRVRLSNAFGTRAITVSHATVASAQSASSGDAAPGSLRDLAFGGQRQVTLPPGADALSDPVSMKVAALSDLLVSVYVPGSTGLVSGHEFASQDNFLGGGDRTAALSDAAFTRIQCWMFVSDVDVRASARYTGTVVTLGDSITDGFNSTADANRRWPDVLARRLNALAGPSLSVVNAGLVGNRLLAPVDGYPQYGVPALARLDRDVFRQAGACKLIVLEGVNDLTRGATAQQVIAAYERIIAQARAHRLRVFGATLTPFGGAIFDSPAYEATRTAINNWIMTSRAFDGVIDFARALGSPGNPQALRPAFDSGDHTHPSDAGYQAMAGSIDLGMLTAGSCGGRLPGDGGAVPGEEASGRAVVGQQGKADGTCRALGRVAGAGRGARWPVQVGAPRAGRERVHLEPVVGQGIGVQHGELVQRRLGRPVGAEGARRPAREGDDALSLAGGGRERGGAAGDIHDPGMR